MLQKTRIARIIFILFCLISLISCNEKKSRLVGKQKGHNPIWHPNGQSLIFSNWDNQLWRTYQINLKSLEVSLFDPARIGIQYIGLEWSANGKSLVFWRHPFQNPKSRMPTIWRFDFDTSSVHQLTKENEDAEDPCWINQDQGIIYGENRRRIWIMDRDGQNRQLLIANGYRPHCFSKGQWIIYNMSYSENTKEREYQGDIFAFNIKTEERIQLSHSGNIKGANFSPDGKLIVFIRIIKSKTVKKRKKTHHKYEYQIVIADFPSMDNQRIVYQSEGRYKCIPAWSPDGKHLTWNHNGLWVIDL